MTTIVQVAVGVVIDAGNRVLIALRPDSAHQGGQWEFPGGKCEPGIPKAPGVPALPSESVEDALRRELLEETGIHVLAQEPLCVIRHDYGDKRVLLDVRRVTAFEGVACGREGQQVKWAEIASLDPAWFPAANRAIVRRLQLPPTLAITGRSANEEEFRARFLRLLEVAPGMIQLRDPDVAVSVLLERARWCLPLCRERGIRLLVNVAPALIDPELADGVHLNSRRLLAQQVPLTTAGIGSGMLVSASCHDAQQLAHAQAMAVDFALLSPVLPTASHPGMQELGWSRFQQLTADVGLPVYALGGVSPDELTVARTYGASGIAALSAYWDAAPSGSKAY